MKIDVSRIIIDHLMTLRDFESKKVSRLDIFLFYIVPLLLGLLAFFGNLSFTREFYNLSITFFGIFIALLLNMQVAIFGIYMRKRQKSHDDIVAEIQSARLSKRNLLLRELNSNISYLVLICCIALVASLIFFTKNLISGLYSSSSVTIYVHFLLTLLMIVKRSHALFQGEYADQ